MEPTFIMTAKDIESLKAQIKNEIIEDMNSPLKIKMFGEELRPTSKMKYQITRRMTDIY